MNAEDEWVSTGVQIYSPDGKIWYSFDYYGKVTTARNQKEKLKRRDLVDDARKGMGGDGSAVHNYFKWRKKQINNK